MYVSHSLFLVNHSLGLSPAAAAAIFAVGYVCICINYDADRQRAHARETKGECIIWGAKPRMLDAHYVTEAGERKSSQLLLSGWWSVSRHFHYLPELAAAACWSAPAGVTHFLPWFYLAFLTPLLFDRGKSGLQEGGACRGTGRRCIRLACHSHLRPCATSLASRSVPRRQALRVQVRQVLAEVLPCRAVQGHPFRRVKALSCHVCDSVLAMEEGAVLAPKCGRFLRQRSTPCGAEEGFRGHGWAANKSRPRCLTLRELCSRRLCWP